MLLPRPFFLRKRDDEEGKGVWIWIIIGAVGVCLIILVALFNTLRKRRSLSETPPKLLPKFLHARWRKWQPGKPTSYSHLPTPLESQQRSHLTSNQTPSIREPDDLDRRTSVRSIMTLPPYRTTPLPTERLIAREGERAGVDTVVEYPETEDVEEARREQEMATLFSIRQARRREQEERDLRRQMRREAREAGNWQLLEELERESRVRAEERQRREQTIIGQIEAAEAEGGAVEQDSSFLIAELQSLRERNARGRRVSSVSYAELGTARHDGSRIRAGSFESDNHPLLDSAASIGQRSRATSRASSAVRGPSVSIEGGLTSLAYARPSIGGHGRHVSDGGASYMDDEDRHTGPQPPLFTPQSSEELPPNPPSYDDDLSVHGGEAPPYESPIERRPSPFRDPEDDDQTRDRSNTADEEPRDEARATQQFLSRDENGRDGRTVGTPVTSSQGRGDNELHDVEPVHGHAKTSASQGSTVRSPPLRLDTRPRVAPQLEVISATPVSTAPNSPIDSRTGPRAHG